MEDRWWVSPAKFMQTAELTRVNKCKYKQLVAKLQCMVWINLICISKIVSQVLHSCTCKGMQPNNFVYLFIYLYMLPAKPAMKNGQNP